MANAQKIETFAKLIVLIAILKCSATESPVQVPGRNGQKDEALNVSTESQNQLTIDRQYYPKSRNSDRLDVLKASKASSLPVAGGGGHKDGKLGTQKDRLNNSNRDLHRRNHENKKDSGKIQSNKWSGKLDDYFRKSNAESFVGKSHFRLTNEGKKTDLNAIKMSSEENASTIISSSKHHLRNHDEYSSRKSGSDEVEEYPSLGNRQRKVKKHGGTGSFVPYSPGSRERKPNIILILTDDQDVELGSLNFMPKTLRLLRDGGAEFRHAYVTTPMCCPSRSSLLTGMYVHNHNVFTNNDNCSNIQWQQTHETRTFATYLSNAGYRTGYFGKYLNKYNGSYIPPGWREWGGLIMNSRYYNYSINLNGKKVKHGFDYHKDYYPDLIANDSIAFLRQSKQYFSRKPVMLVVSFPAPHGPEDSAPQYSKMFFNVTTHHTPSYDYAPNPDKQWILRVTNKMQNIHKQFTDTLMTKRLQTLQSVDLAVERIYQELKNIGELDNTYIIYTSDHGYHLGQFGLVKGKSFPFEFDVRVPFLVRGPGIESGSVVDDIVLNIDLAPTFLDLAGVESPMHMDGRSIVRLFHNKSNKRRRIKWPDTFLIESSGRREMPDAMDRKREKQKAEESNLVKEKGFVKSRAPEGTNRNFEEEKIKKIIKEEEEEDRKESAEGISGDEAESEISDEEDVTGLFNQGVYYDGSFVPLDSFSQVENKIPQLVQDMTHPIPKLARLALECQNPELRSPCRPGQKWHCVVDGDRWRKYKCKFQRKCTCFTPNGFVYTALYHEDGEKRLNYGKKKSDEFNLWKQATSRIDSTTISSITSRSSRVSKRRRRETVGDHILDIWDDLEHELMETEETKMVMNATFSFGEEPNASRCLVTPNGKVNCSRLIYNDLKTWKRSRNKIESKIKRLKNELEALKEIRKHLKEKRPDPKVMTSNNLSRNKNISLLASPNESTTGEPVITVTVTGFTKSQNETTFATQDFVATTVSLSGRSQSGETTEYVPTTTTPRSQVMTVSRKPVETDLRRVNNGGRYNNSENGVSNKINGVLTIFRGTDKCICRAREQDVEDKKEEKEMEREAKKRLKQKKLKKKEKKLRKKAKLEKECLSEKMNCFMHDNEHWRTPPLWTAGPFCFCMNANNNTYSCLRTINSTHNFLYCEFTTGFKTYYNLRIDPFEQLNRISTLSVDESRYLSNQLADMKACKGSKECAIASGKEIPVLNHHHNHHRQHHYLPNTFNPGIKKEFIY